MGDSILICIHVRSMEYFVVLVNKQCHVYCVWVFVWDVLQFKCWQFAPLVVNRDVVLLQEVCVYK